jgi:DNA-binding CsgD family transcriptional regulator
MVERENDFFHPPAAEVVVDREDRIVSWGRGAKRLLGSDEPSVAGRRLQEVLDGRDAFGNLLCREACWLREMLRLGEPVRRFELDARHADGNRLRLVVEVDPAGPGPSAGWAYRLFPERRRRDRRRVPPPAPPEEPRSEPPDFGLTPRETEVLLLLARGANTDEIAGELGISPTTARNHVQHLLEKLGARTRLEALSLAHRNRLL